MTVEQRIASLTGTPVTRLRSVAGGDICRAYRVDLDDGRRVFAKAAGRPGMTAAEAAGLRWLAGGGAATPEVIGHDEQVLVLSWTESAAATPSEAAALGRMLARLHASGAAAFGSAPPGAPGSGWIGSAPMAYAASDSWPEFFVEHRILPYLQAARSAGTVTAAQAATIRAVCDRIPAFAGPPVPPARLHGDLWGGNVLWGPGSGVLIDPAAHGGHPESDLAMLLLFPPRHVEAIIAGYESRAPLNAGWRSRIDLHQLYPLLVHAVLFGGGYGSAAARAAERVLAR